MFKTLGKNRKNHQLKKWIMMMVKATKMTHVQKKMTLSSRKMNPEKNEKTKPAYLIKRKQLVRR